MLEIKHVSKIYKSRGEEVRALDDINLYIQDKGMVFILGKSGSGKSTLLNVLGGLDRFDEGEIIIRGKSSKDFKQSDFDSYRNTFIGFIFQEYNVMDNFTVKENIALALQLQGKKADAQSMQAILDEVDLRDLEDRKPNELSGGQLQRVAIARALIKQPKIILADEPTGALDSHTGAQVLDTLKKLSHDRLVLIVSHDKEFAKNYADRIIELADGKIINDTSKELALPQQMHNGMTIVENELITVRNPQILEARDLQLIMEEIRKHKGDLVISFDNDTNKEIKKARHMTENGELEVFHTTSDAHIHRDEGVSAKVSFIRSKLPFGSSMKMTLSNLKLKPFRLFMTIVLSVASFTLFGLSNTMTNYEPETATYHSMKDSRVNYISIGKQRVVDLDGYPLEISSTLTREDIQKLQKTYPEALFSDTFAADNYGTSLDTSSYISEQDTYYSDENPIYPSDFSALSTLDDEVIKENNFTLTGSLPQQPTDIVMTKIHAQTFVQYGYQTILDNGESKRIPIASADDMIGKRMTLMVNGEMQEFTVCGILDTKVDLSRYQKDSGHYDQDGVMSYYVKQELAKLLYSSYHTLGFICEDQFETYVNDYAIYSSDLQFTVSLSIGEDYYDVYQFYCVDDMADERVIDFQNGGDIYLDYEMVKNISVEKGMSLHDYIMGKLTSDDEDEQIRIIREAVKKYQDKIENSDHDLMVYSPYDAEPLENRKIGGIFIDKSFTESFEDHAAYSASTVALTDTFMKENDIHREGHAVFAVSPIGNDQMLRDVIADTYNEAKEHYRLDNQVMPMLLSVNSILNTMAPVFFYMGIGFAIFAAVLFCNFIATSIANKKREIGILRAVGARGLDVLKIFLNESLIIALLNWILAIIACWAAVAFINAYIRNEFNVLVTILHFGTLQIALLLILAVGVAIVASALPVFNISRKKPIDAIKNRK